MKTAEEKSALAKQAMPKVERIVLVMKKRFGPHADLEEIRSFALDGLAQSIERYDPSRNVPIEIFAAKRVEGQILDGLSKNKQLPRRLLREVAFVKKSQEMLRCEQQTPPPRDKVEAVHRLADRLKELACVYVTSCSTEDEQQIQSEDIPDAETVVAHKKYYGVVKAAISQLPPNHRVLVQQYFYEDKTLAEIAAGLGKSRSWACRNLQTALKILREYF